MKREKTIAIGRRRKTPQPASDDDAATPAAKRLKAGGRVTGAKVKQRPDRRHRAAGGGLPGGALGITISGISGPQVPNMSMSPVTGLPVYPSTLDPNIMSMSDVTDSPSDYTDSQVPNVSVSPITDLPTAYNARGGQVSRNRRA